MFLLWDFWYNNPFEHFTDIVKNVSGVDKTSDTSHNLSHDLRVLEPILNTTHAPVSASTSNYDIYDQVYYPLMGFLFLVGVLGNLLVIVQTIRDRELHSPTFAVIASLACADLMFLMIRIPLEFVFKFTDDWILGDVLCRLYMYLLQCVAYAEAYHLVLLAIVRYYQLTRPLEALRNLTTTKALYFSVTLWLSIFVVLSPILVFTGVTHYYMGSTDTKGVRVCFLKTKSKFEQEVYFLCYSVFCFLLPMFILILFHAGKAIKLRRGNRFAKSNKRLKVMSAAVVCILVLFGVLLAPVHINNILTIMGIVKNHPASNIVMKLMAYLNSVINPLIYAFCAQKVRKSCLKCLLCRKVCHK